MLTNNKITENILHKNEDHIKTDDKENDATDKQK
jgi:hypothetical protein